MSFFETNEITQENVLDQIKRLREQVGSKSITDTEIDQTRKYIASVREDGSVNPTEEGTFVDWEDLVHKRNNQKMGIMKDTHGKINSLSWNNTIETRVLQNVVAYKKQVETLMNVPLTAANLSWFLKELPPENQDPLGRAFMVQGMVGKLRRDGYMLYTTGDGIVVESENESLRENAAVLQEALKSHMQHEYIGYHDLDQAFVTGSKSLETYRSTQVNVNERNTGEYADFLMKKYNIDRQSVTDSKDITSRNDIPKEDQSFLVSYLAHGISPTTPLAPMLENYDARKAQLQAFLESKEFIGIESAVNKAHDTATGAEVPTPPINAKETAWEGTRDPSVLTGKPLTTIAAGLAIVAGLGYEGKGKWFSFWTGLKRGFLAILTLFLGAGVMKEWGMDPKALMNEGLDAIKKGGVGDPEKILPESQLPKDDTSSKTPPPSKPEETPKENLTISQHTATEKVKGDTELSTDIDQHIKDTKGEDKGTLDDYLAYINSPGFQNKKVGEILAPDDIERSVFNNSEKFSASADLDIPPTLNYIILKQVLRLYVTGNRSLSTPADGAKYWVKEQEEFNKKHDISKDSDKTMKELIEKVYAK